MIKITLVISSLGSGGAERVMSELSNYLVKKNYMVTIITLSSPTQRAFYSLSSKVILQQINMQSSGDTKLFHRIIDILLRCYKLRQTIIDSTPDVVLSFTDVMNITTLLSMKGVKIPIIVSERIDPNHHKIPRFYSWLRNKLYRDSYRIIVQTKSSLEYFSSKIKEKSQIISNPNRLLSTYERKIELKPKIIVSVGRLEKQKDHETLIKAMLKVISEYPNVILKIYGEGSLREKLQELINEFGLEQNIYLEGLSKNIEKCLEQADLFVFPSLYEGFPNALLEAMATGLPCIASNVSGNNDIIEANINGKLFDARDTNMLSTLIIELLGDNKLRKKFSIASKKKVLLYNPDNIFSQWEKLFMNACS